MIHVILTSELPWQQNDAFVFLGTSSFFFFFFCRNRLKELLLPLVASIMAKFEQTLWERFRSILKKRFKGHKNNE